MGWFLYTFATLAVDMRLWLLVTLVTALVVATVRMCETVEGSLETFGVAGLMLIVGLSSSFVFGEAPAVAGRELSEHGMAGPRGTRYGSGAGTSSLPNVYHLVFDEFQTEMFEVARAEALERGLRGFRSFPEGSTPYGRTEMAMASMFASRSLQPTRGPVAGGLQQPEERVFVRERALHVAVQRFVVVV